jgi:hypothetical protein
MNWCFSKVGFLAFIAMVINCTAEIECKSQKIDVLLQKSYTVDEQKSPVLPGRRPGVRSVRVEVVKWGGDFYFYEIV